MEELQSEDLGKLLQELSEEYGAPDPIPQRVRVCPKCGKHNSESAWHCCECGTTLSIETLTDKEAAQRAENKSPGASEEKHLEEEHGAQEPLPPEVEELLRELQSGSDGHTRREAAEQLGKVDISSLRIVQALIVARKSDTHTVVRDAAARALRAPVHQDYLQEHPQMRQSAERIVRDMQPVATALQRGPSRPCARKKPATDTALVQRVGGGILLVGIGVGVTEIRSNPGWTLICVLVGLALVAWSIWEWQAPTSRRNRFLRSMKQTSANVDQVSTEKVAYDERTYHLKVLFRVDDAQGGSRDVLLKLEVARGIWKSLGAGSTVTVRYAAEDPSIALIQGEW